MPTVNLDTASRLDIICRKGDTFNLTIDFGTALDSAYSGDDFKLEVRDTDTSTGTAASDGLILSAEGAEDFTVGSGDTAGKLTIEIEADTMQKEGGEYVYDLQSSSPSTGVKTWLHGFFTIIEDITEPNA